MLTHLTVFSGPHEVFTKNKNVYFIQNLNKRGILCGGPSIPFYIGLTFKVLLLE